MHLVGSDALAVVDSRGVPAGPRHAVASGQRAVCSESRPRFLWPALSWDALDDAACPDCVGALPSADDPYTADERRPRAEVVLWQPPLGLFETPGATAS